MVCGSARQLGKGDTTEKLQKHKAVGLKFNCGSGSSNPATTGSCLRSNCGGGLQNRNKCTSRSVVRCRFAMAKGTSCTFALQALRQNKLTPLVHEFCFPFEFSLHCVAFRETESQAATACLALNGQLLLGKIMDAVSVSGVGLGEARQHVTLTALVTA